VAEIDRGEMVEENTGEMDFNLDEIRPDRR
jgi:hypothetical protein